MTARNEKDVALEHALRNENNLSVALLVGAAYEELRGQVVVSFLQAVEKELSARLGPQWHLTSWHDPAGFATRDPELLVAEFLGHPAKFALGLDTDGKAFPKLPYLAIWVGQRDMVQPALLDQLKTTVDKDFAPGKPYGDSTIWWRYTDKAYSGWDSEETLIQLYRKDEALAHFVGHMESVARILENTLSSK